MSFSQTSQQQPDGGMCTLHLRDGGGEGVGGMVFGKLLLVIQQASELLRHDEKKVTTTKEAALF